MHCRHSNETKRKQKGNRKETEKKQKEQENKPGDNPIFKAASFESPIQAQDAP